MLAIEQFPDGIRNEEMRRADAIVKELTTNTLATA